MTVIRNLSGAPIELDDLSGITSPGSPRDLDLNTLEISGIEISTSQDLATAVAAGDIVFLDAQGNQLTQQETEDSINNATATTPAVVIQDGGTNVPGTPHSKLNFDGAGVTLVDAGSGVVNLTISGGGGGDVSGPGGSPVTTDNAIVRWDGTTGQLIQNSNAILDDAGNVDFTGTITGGDLRIRHDSNSDLDIIFDANGRDGATGASISRDGASGFLWWFPNAPTVQWLMGDPSGSPLGSNRMFFDVDMRGELFMQVLPGAGRNADIIATHGAKLRPNEDSTSDLGRGSPLGRWNNLWARTINLSNTAGDNISIQAPASVFTNYSLTLPTSDGDANQVLTTDGNGVLTWSTKATAGGSVTGIWKYDNSTSASDPGSGEFRINNADPALATALFISDESEPGGDWSAILGALDTGDIIYLQNVEDATEGILVTISSTPTDNGSWYNIPITVNDTNGASSFDDGKEFGFVFVIGISDNGITELTGDVTAGPGSGTQTATINTDAVDNTKLANMVQATIKGRASGAGTGDPTDLTAAQVRTIINVEDGAAADQNLFETISADVGSTTADSTTDTLTIAGGSNVTTTIVGDTLTIDATGGGGSTGSGVEKVMNSWTNLSGNLFFNDFVHNLGTTAVTFFLRDTATDQEVRGEYIEIIDANTARLVVEGNSENITMTVVAGGVGSPQSSGGSGDVTAAANIVDNSLVRGDGGVKGIQDSVVTGGSPQINWTLDDDGQMIGTGDVSGDYVLTVRNRNATSGDGFRVRAGESLGDIAFSIEDSDGSFNIMQLEADQGFVTLGKTYAQTLSDNGVVYGVDLQNGGVASDFNTQAGQYRMGGNPIPLAQYHLFADQVEFPTNADWDVTVGAPASADANNAALTVRLFDDTTQEAFGFALEIPELARNMTVTTKARAITAPGAAAAAVMELHRRAIPDNGAIGAWTSSALTTIDIPTNTNFQYDQTTDTLAGWGLTAGTVYQWQLSRTPAAGGDTLVGDLAVLELCIVFD